MSRGTKISYAAAAAALAAAGGVFLYATLAGRREGEASVASRITRARRRSYRDPVDEAIDESFPASDPPSYSPTRAGEARN